MPVRRVDIVLRFDPSKTLPVTERVALSTRHIQLIMAEMDIVTLQCFSQVSRSYAPIARSELALRISHTLKLHISDYRTSSGFIMSHPIRRRCSAFLDMLRRTGSVIAGQAALAVMLTQTDMDGAWQDGRDLEILTPRDAVPRVLTYLVQFEHYSIGCRTKRAAVKAHLEPIIEDGEDESTESVRDIAVPSAQFIHGEAIESITHLQRDWDTRRIVIIESSGISALLPLAASATTLLVNYFTSTTLVSMYPKLSMNGVGIKNPGAYSTKDAEIWRRYTEYGFHIQDAEHDLEECRSIGSYCPRRLRRSEDSLSFTMAFGRITEPDSERRWRAQSYIPETYWVWGGWDHHEQHPNAPFVAPEYGVFITN